MTDNIKEQIEDIKRTCNLENPESYAYKNKAVAKLSINALSIIRQLQEENRQLKEQVNEFEDIIHGTSAKEFLKDKYDK